MRDNRLTLGDATRLRDNVPVKTVISPEDKRKLNQGYTVRGLDLPGHLGDTVYCSAQVVVVHYYCGHTVFFYKPPLQWGSQVYPEICPFGDPAYIEV